MPVRPVTLAAAVLASTLAASPLPAAELTPLEREVVRQVDDGHEAAVALLRQSVDVPSATEDHAGVRRVGELYAAELKALGFATRWVDQAAVSRAGHLVAERKGPKGKRLLLIGHLDTVLAGEPFRREGGRAYGSGVADMKGGNAIALAALRALHRAGALDGTTVTAFFTGDEEDTGKPFETSRAALVEAARRSDAALAFEGYAPGTAVVGRRGFSSWRLEVTGSQGHSSGIFGEERGSGAVFEAARILSAFHDELREPYLTYNPSVLLGGSDVAYDAAAFSGTASGKTNVVARRAVAAGDLRFLTRQQLESARERMRAVVARSLPATSARIEFTDGMPSLEPSQGGRALLRLLDGISRDLGAGPVEEHDPSKRGAGDVSFVGPWVAAIDGLGALGEHEHAPGEWCDLEEMRLLTKRAALLVLRLTRPE